MRRRECWVVLIVTVLCVITNIAIAVLIGCGLTALVYAWESMKYVQVSSKTAPDGMTVYEVSGPLFFGSGPKILKSLTPEKDAEKVIVDFTKSSVMDFSGL